MIEVFIISLVALVIFATGYPVAHYADKRNSVVLSPPLGLAVVTILTTALYVLDWSMQKIATAVIALAFLCAVWGFIKLDVIGCLKQETRALSVYAVVLALVFLPAILGGVQFSVFQGNIWDHFNYLTGSVAYSKYSYSELLNADNSALLDDPPKIMGKISLTLRPTVFFLFALILAHPVGTLSILAYLFVALLISLTFFSILYLVRVTLLADRQTGARSQFAVAIVAAVIPLGFWGQYVLDINAWSHAASISLLALFLACSTRAVRAAVNGGVPDRVGHTRLFGVLFLVMGASVLVYPESTFLHVAAAGGAIAILWMKRSLTLRHAAILALGLSAGLLGGLVNYSATFGFFFRQLEFGVSGSPDWWAYFHQFLLGRDNVVNFVVEQVRDSPLGGNGTASIKSAARTYLADHLTDPGVMLRLAILPLNVILGVCGLYFLTIKMTYSTLAIFGWMVLAILAIYGLARVIIAAGRLIRATAGDSVFHYHLAFLGFLVLVPFALLVLGQIWSAGKAVSLLAPYLTAALAVPIVGVALGAKPAGRSAATIGDWVAASLYVFFAIGLSSYRIYAAATDEHGIHYAHPYPAVLHAESKTKIRWGMDQDSLKQCSAVKLEIPDPFVRQHLTLQLSHLDKKYYHDFPVKTSYGLGNDIGYMRKMPTDCVVVPFEENGVTRSVVRRR